MFATEVIACVALSLLFAEFWFNANLVAVHFFCILVFGVFSSFFLHFGVWSCFGIQKIENGWDTQPVTEFQQW